MGIEYNIDERLYNSLCAGVEKWFEKNKAYVGMHNWDMSLMRIGLRVDCHFLYGATLN